MLRVLTFTTLFPNAEQPRHGIFIEHRLRQLVRHARGAVQARVVAPVPWFPFAAPAFGHYATLARVAPREVRDGIEVLHPRYLVIPKVGMALAPTLLAAGARATLRRLRDEGFDFDVIDAHFLYPDGVAAVALGREFGRPVVLSARGSDVHQYRHLPSVWRRTLAAADRAAHVVTVSESLRAPLLAGGLAPERVSTLRNGVDLELFRPVPREQARADLGVRRPLLLSVGNLVPLKGHDLVVDALAALPEAELVVIGNGPERAALEQRARGLGVDGRFRLLPAMDQESLCRWYSAADLLVLASSNEGWPNVLLESMACGTPVVATAVGGVPEIVRSAPAGRVVGERSAAALAAACRALLAERASPDAVREYAAGFDWERTSAGLLDILAAARDGSRAPQASPLAAGHS